MTAIWFAYNAHYWDHFVSPLAGREVHALEIGSFEGLSAVWMLQRALTHPQSTLTCIDSFELTGGGGYDGYQNTTVRALFEHNMRPFAGKVRVHARRSEDVLPQLTGPYDLIYIDGDHHSISTLRDAVMAFPLLKPGGLLIFDDYGWQHYPPGDVRNPRRGIDAFLQVYAEELEVLASAYQLYLRRRL